MVFSNLFVASEDDLKRKIVDLKKQLREAEVALEGVEGDGKVEPKGSDNGSTDVDESTRTFGKNGVSSSMSELIRSPVGHRGYLFKWQDRSIGWGGTKWALRFVSLQQGKISYFRSHNDTEPRYVLSLRGFAVRDEGLKLNSKHSSKGGKHVSPPKDEVGAYFHVFSIYQRLPSERRRRDHDRSRFYEDSTDSDETVTEVVPLLRFSTPSLAEKTQWITRISESCAYCDTNAFLEDEKAAMVEAENRKEQQISMYREMPQAARGTLPPLYFAPAPVPNPSLKRVPSGITVPKLGYRTASGSMDAEKLDARSTKGYPPSKPMHRSTAPSYLSSEAPMQNYRGLFNLGIIILIVSNARLLLDTLKTHGSVFDKLPDLPKFAVSHDRWGEFPIISGFAVMQVFIILSFCYEKLLSLNLISNTLGMFLHYLNAHGCLLVSIYMVWNHIENPFIGALVLFYGVITWMKLVSYLLANQDYRTSPDDTHKATLALVHDLDAEGIEMEYPNNVTIGNIYYFWLAPTLTYQMAFPRTPRIRFWRIGSLILQLFVSLSIGAFIVAQVTTPNLIALVDDLQATNGVYTFEILTEYGLRLSIANTYCWLLMFYSYFHAYLNLWAEILRFGDRVFYKDWWNSSEVGAYWRLWNAPVHYWVSLVVASHLHVVHACNMNHFHSYSHYVSLSGMSIFPALGKV